MAIFGDLITRAMGGFPENPKVPVWNNITLSDAQANSIKSNLASIPGLENIASKVNAFNTQQIQSMLASVIPGFDQIQKNVAGNIADLTAGKIPTDVAEAVQGSSAARALTGGFGGSGLAGNLTARDLGLTSLGLTQTGLSSAESWTSMMDQVMAPGMFNISSMFVSPQQEFQTEMENQTNAWNVQWLHNQIKAMPDPGKAAIARDVGGIADNVVGVLSTYLTGGTGLASTLGVSSGAASSGGGGGGL